MRRPIVAMLGTYAIGLALRESVRTLLGGQFYSVTAPLVGSFVVRRGLHFQVAHRSDPDHRRW